MSFSRSLNHEIYRIEDDILVLTLSATGPHSDLFDL
jgi:mRNA-degrading endonuclease YafQ of YafQ-DinJ toxin-antitoxin module